MPEWIVILSVYDDFDKILSEFMAMSAEMPKVANKLREVLRKRIESSWD